MRLGGTREAPGLFENVSGEALVRRQLMVRNSGVILDLAEVDDLKASCSFPISCESVVTLRISQLVWFWDRKVSLPIPCGVRLQLPKL